MADSHKVADLRHRGCQPSVDGCLPRPQIPLVRKTPRDENRMHPEITDGRGILHMHGSCGPSHMREDAIVRDLQTTKNETDINHGASRELLDVVNIEVRIEPARVLYV